MTTEGVASLLEELSRLKTCNEEEGLTQSWEKCLCYGVRLCKAMPSKCDWFCSKLVGLLKDWKFRGKIIVCGDQLKKLVIEQ